MKQKIYAILIILVSLLSVNKVFASGLSKVQLIQVHNANKIEVKSNNNNYNLRLYNLECPEDKLNEKAEFQAKQHNMKVDEIIANGRYATYLLQDKLYDKNNIYIEFLYNDKSGNAIVNMYLKTLIFKNNVNKYMKTNGSCFENMN